MDWAWNAIFGFVGTLAALLVTKTVERWWTKKLDQRKLSSDALLDMVSTLTAVEDTLRTLPGCAVPKTRDELAATPSGWDLSGTSIKLDALLATFDDQEVHHAAMLFHERHRTFVSQSAEREKAFYWLLDNKEVAWEDPRAQERITVLQLSQRNLEDCAWDMAREGWKLASRLYELGTDGISIDRRPALTEWLRRDYGLDAHAIRLRRSYYASYLPPGVFDPSVEHILVKWDDAVAGLVVRRGGLALDIGSIGGDGQETRCATNIPPLREVALPAGATVRKIVVFSSGREVDLGEVDMPLRSLKRVDGDVWVLSLDSGQMDRARRLLDAPGSMKRLPG